MVVGDSVNEQLPPGWALTKLDELVSLLRGVTYNNSQSSDTAHEGYLPIIRANNIQKDKLILRDFVYVQTELVKEIQKIRKNDIIVAMSSGSKSVVGKTAKSVSDIDAGFGAFCGLLRPTKLVVPEIISFYTRGSYYRNKVSELSAGANINNLKPAHFSELDFPLPPFAEQKVIAEKLDTLLAQVDNTKARLERIPEILKRFRQSVLAAAVSGKLTEDNAFKKRHLSSLKIIGKLTGGKTPSKSNARFWENGNIPWVSPKDMKSDFIDGSKDHITEQALGEAGMRLLPENTLLMVTRSGILAHSFPVALTKVPVTINQDIKAFTADTGKVKVDFCLYLIKGLEQRILNECSKAGTTVPSVETELLENLMFELPTLEEQTEIVRRVEELFAFADRIEQAAQAALSRVNNLTQSILAKAFRGELTADWRAANPELISGENSAEALLARIKAERAKLKPTKKAKA